MSSIWFLILFFLLTFVLTGGLRLYALKKGVMDTPNERSSHTIATPRGGGLSFVIAFLLGFAWLAFQGEVDSTIAVLFCSAGMTVAVMGWLDDHQHINAKWRLLAHFSAVAMIVYACGGLPPISLFGHSLALGWFGILLAVVGLVWVLNLYNFMDGIDGLATIQAVMAALVAGFQLYLVYDTPQLAYLHWLLVACCFGFLLWNFPVAKIFMGDAGSGFLGLMLGALMLFSSHVDQRLLWSWLILLGVFIVDATFTLLRRLLRKEPVFQAHCMHAYQHASRKFESHKVVSLAVCVLIALWLGPLATLVALGWIDGLLALIIAYIPLIIMAITFKAGTIDS